ncbi:hypothetical protein D3C80_566420 [compost metagenome]
MRQVSFDVGTGFDKVDGVVVMLFNTGSNGENIRVENNVFRREADALGQNFIGTAANLEFALARIGLAHFVKRHHHHRGTVTTHQLGMVNKGLFALFHRDGVNDAFALNALQAFFDHRPFGGVDHDRHPGDIRLTGDQVEKTHHRRFRVEHPLIHVDVDNLGAAFHLLASNRQRFAVFLFFDQPLKACRAGHVGTLTHVDEQRFGIDV